MRCSNASDITLTLSSVHVLGDQVRVVIVVQQNGGIRAVVDDSSRAEDTLASERSDGGDSVMQLTLENA